jgi:hypothetical protein
MADEEALTGSATASIRFMRPARRSSRLRPGLDSERVLDEIIDRRFEIEHGLFNVNHFGGSFARNMHAEQAAGLVEKIIFIMPLLSPMMWPRKVSRKRATPTSQGMPR